MTHTNTNQHQTRTANQCGSVTAITAQNDRLLRIKEVCDMTGLGKTSVYSVTDFPKRVTLSARAVGWRLSEVQAWIESRSTVGAQS